VSVVKTLLFIGMVLASGAAAGLIHGGVNLGLVEPYLDEAIGIENQSLFASGEAEDNEEFWNSYHSYRTWQKGGQVLAGLVLGVSMGSLFGIVFALSRRVLPGTHEIKKAVILAGIMWLVVFLIPILKYPANPPTVGDAETVELRTALYVAFTAVSGFGAVAFYQIGRRVKRSKKAVAVGGYAGLMMAAFVLMPSNPDPVTAPADLVDGFRLVSALGVSSFWISVSLILGALWQRLKPDADIRLRP